MSWPADVGADLRHGARLARRSPWFAVTAIAVLAVGIGASVAVYTVLREVLFRPLPYADPDRIVHLLSTSPSGINQFASAPQFLHWRAETSVFEALTAIQDPSPAFTISINGRNEAVRALRVSADYFAVFRAPLIRGRGFTRGEDGGRARVVVLSDGFWRRQYGGADVIGRSLWLAEEPYEIVGVLAQSFAFDATPDVIVPVQAETAALDHTKRLRVIGRLRPGVSLAAARADAERTTSLFRRDRPFVLGHYEYFTADLLHTVLVGPIRPMLQLIAGAVVLVLLVTCANVAMLLLSRAQLRTPEVAARIAVGASRARIVRQLLIETQVLALLGGALALPLASVVLRTIAVGGTSDLPWSVRALADGLAIDVSLMGEALIGALVTGALCGVLPALTASRTEVSSLFKSGATAAAVGWKGGRVQAILLVSEVAAALVLLAATAIVLQSVARLRTIDLGFDPRNVQTFEVPLTATPFRYGPALDMFVNNATARLSDVAGVGSFAASFSVPTDEGSRAPFTVPDRGLLATGMHHGTVRWEIVTPGYFNALRVARLDGRVFDERDRRGGPGVAVVNRTMALRYWARQKPVGQRITLGGADWPEPDVTRQIVGVVADVRRPDDPDAEPIVYIPMAQAGDPLLARQQLIASLRWIVRAGPNRAAVSSAIARSLEEAGPGISVMEAASMNDVIAARLARARFALQLLGGFAAVAVLLATVGLYGFISNAVTQRRKELGIRTALGASSADLLHMIVWQGGRIVLGGIACGLVGATLIGVGLERVIFGTRPLPVEHLAGLALLQLIVAIGASIIAALPVTRIDPRRVIE